MSQILGIKGGEIQLWIGTNERNTSIVFMAANPKPSYDLIGITLDAINLKGKFDKSQDNNYNKYFSFPDQEDEMKDFLVNFLILLDENVDKIKNAISREKANSQT
jgi:hypothetical protein